MPDALDPPILERQIADPLDAIVDLFRGGTALVDAALVALIRVDTEIATTRDIIRRDAGHDAVTASVAVIRWHLDGATVGDDNLLVMRATASPAKPLLVFALSKTASGALTTQTIPIERAPLVVMMESDSSTAFGQLEALLRERATGTTIGDSRQWYRGLDRLSDRIAAARSRLSVVKARLDLQSSFVSAVAEADRRALSTRVDSHVSLAGARDLALETRRLLSRQPLGIGSTNRQVIQTLFQRHGS